MFNAQFVENSNILDSDDQNKIYDPSQNFFRTKHGPIMSPGSQK